MCLSTAKKQIRQTPHPFQFVAVALYIHSRDLVFGFVSFHELCVLPKFLVTRQLTLLAGVQRRNARLFARQDFGRPYPVGQAELPIEAMRSFKPLGRPWRTCISHQPFLKSTRVCFRTLSCLLCALGCPALTSPCGVLVFSPR